MVVSKEGKGGCSHIFGNAFAVDTIMQLSTNDIDLLSMQEL